MAGMSLIPGSGKVWYVNSVTGQDANGKGKDPSSPFATIAYAVSATGVVSGDIILVAPLHVETISAAAGINLNVAGITVVGLGNRSQRPAITLGTAVGATIALAAAGCELINLHIDATGFDAITKAINVTAAGCALRFCKLVQSGATNQATNMVTLGAGASQFTIDSCECDASGAAGAASFLASAAAVADLTVKDSNIYGDFSVAPFSSTSTFHITNMLITRNRLRQSNGTAKNVFNFTTSSTGTISHNTCEGTTWSTAADVASNSTSTSLRWFQNFGFDDGAGAVSGVLVPAAGTIA